MFISRCKNNISKVRCPHSRQNSRVVSFIIPGVLFPFFRSSTPMIRVDISLQLYFLANVIVIALLGVILKPLSVSFAFVACVAFSNSTKAISWRPGTNRTSLYPSNLRKTFVIVRKH